MQIRPVASSDLNWIRDLLVDRWGATYVVSRGRIHHADRLPGFLAHVSGRPTGLITYALQGKECEVATLDSLDPGKGIGKSLIQSVVEVAAAEGCRRVWLITTNDNTRALRFYQRTGFELVALYPNAMAVSRKLKPSIPEIGNHGIPIRDEIELEMKLA